MRLLFLLLLVSLTPTPAAELKGDERVILFPTSGHRVQSGAAWELSIHGWTFEPEPRTAALALFRSALQLKAGELGDAGEAIFAERARWFLVDNERRKRVTVRVAERSVRLNPSGANGHFFDRVRLSAKTMERWRREARPERLSLPTVPAARDGRVFTGEVHLLEDTGLSVVSDIDDTIKLSEVTDREALLRNTFCRPFRPVPGMAAVYQAWATNHGARFHYVSASPWQLYAALAEFTRTNGFPAGTWHLKHFRWKDETFFQLLASPQAYKLGVLEPPLKQFPRRRFVLVGDSGERDPEIYGLLARKYPGQVARIFIRDVTGEPATANRYRSAFAGMPSASWRVFKTPEELRGAELDAN
jgi:hypothetical protein